MVPAIIIAVAFLWSVFVNDSTMEVGFLSGMFFLWAWYLFTTLVACIQIIPLIKSVWGKGSPLTPDETNSMRGTRSKHLAIFTIRVVTGMQLLFLVGSYLLMTSGTPEMDFVEFSISKLVLGTSLLIAGHVTLNVFGPKIISKLGTDASGTLEA